MYIVRMKRRPIKRTTLAEWNERQANEAGARRREYLKSHDPTVRALAPKGYWTQHPTKGWRWNKL